VNWEVATRRSAMLSSLQWTLDTVQQLAEVIRSSRKRPKPTGCPAESDRFSPASATNRMKRSLNICATVAGDPAQSHELPAPEGRHVLSGELEPLTIAPSISKPSMPIAFDARRVIGGYRMDECRLLR